MSEIPELPEGSFLDRLYKYCKNKCKAPDSIVFWTCLAFAGASIKNMMYFDLAHKRIYPNLPLLIIARSGLGKTSAVNTVQRIFKDELPLLLPEDATAESFVRELSKGIMGDTTGGIWIIPELADVIGKKDYKQGSIAKITRLLDNPYDLTISRITYDEPVKIKGYCLLNLIACSTFDWLINHVEQSASSGGFLPRLGVVFCDDKSKFIENPESNDTTEQELKVLLRTHVSGKAHQRITMFPAIRDVLKEFHDEANSCHDDKALPFKERKTENFLRLFMITHLFSSIPGKECVITHQIELAKNLANQLENQGVRLSKTIITHNFLNIYTLKSVSGHLNRHLGKHVSPASIQKSTRVPAHELKPILELLHCNEMILWNQRHGESGVILCSKLIDIEVLISRIIGGSHDLEKSEPAIELSN